MRYIFSPFIGYIMYGYKRLQRLSVHFNLLDEEDAALLHKLQHGASLSGSSLLASGNLNRSIGGSSHKQQQHHNGGSSGNSPLLHAGSSSKLAVDAGDSEVTLIAILERVVC
jgi:hypothetical protein